MSDIRNGTLLTLAALIVVALVFAGGLIRSTQFFMRDMALYRVTIDTGQLALSPPGKQAVPEAVSVSYWGECITIRGNVTCSPPQVGFIEDARSRAAILRGNRTIELPNDTISTLQHWGLRFALSIAVGQLFLGICHGAFAEMHTNKVTTGLALGTSILSLVFIGIALECYVVRIVQVQSILSAVTPRTSVSSGSGVYLIFAAALVQIFAVATFAHGCVIVHRRRKQKKRLKFGPMAVY